MKKTTNKPATEPDILPPETPPESAENVAEAGTGEPATEPVTEGATIEGDDTRTHGDDSAIDDEDDMGDTTAATDLAIERLIRIAEEAEFESGTMVGDIRDAQLDLYKAQHKPWPSLSKADQENIAAAFETVAKIIVRKVVLVVAEADAEGPTIHATLKSYTEDGGFKISLTAQGDEDTALALHKAVKQQVIVKRADPTIHHGQRAAFEGEADQRGLLFEGGEAEVVMPPTATEAPADLGGEFDLPPNGNEGEEPAEAEEPAPAGGFVVHDRDEGVWLEADEGEGGAWTPEIDGAGVFDKARADELAEKYANPDSPLAVEPAEA